VAGWKEDARDRARVPTRLDYRAVNAAGDRLAVAFVPDAVVSTPQDPAVPGREVFLQMRGRYTVTGAVGGRFVRFAAPGYAETFAPLRAR
jgi:hypothetical protein